MGRLRPARRRAPGGDVMMDPFDWVLLWGIGIAAVLWLLMLVA